MFLDGIVLLLLVVALFKGLRNGLALAVFSFLAFIIGLAAAIKLSAVVAQYIGNNVSVSERWLPFIAFAVVFFLVVLLVRFGAKAIEAVLNMALLGWANRLGGVFFYAGIYLFVFSILLFYALQLGLLKHNVVQASVTFPFLQPLGPKIINSIGKILPFFKNMFVQLEMFFGHLAQ